MNRYVDFSIVTKEALEYSCKVLNVKLSEGQKEELIQQYRILPSFDDAKKGAQQLKEAGYPIFAFSNGSRRAVIELLEQAELIDLLDGLVSMEDVKTFKPSPLAYSHFVNTTNSAIKNTWLVSSNAFDVIGAISAGMRAVWVQRSKNSIFDPWGIEPTIVVKDLIELDKVIN